MRNVFWISAIFALLVLSGCGSDDDKTDKASTKSGIQAGPWRVVVLSDIHVKAKTSQVAPSFERLTQAILRELRPNFVIVTGDTTSGNKGDGAGRARAASWWDEAIRAFTPFCAAGIPVFIAAGNHDYYTATHKLAYADAWQKLRACNASIPISAPRPEAYSFNYRNVHFQLTHVVDKNIDPEISDWMRTDLAQNQQAALRFVFAHVPLLSVMNDRNNESAHGFRNFFGHLLQQGRVEAYVAGHEHLFWDEQARLDDGSTVRQVIVGTATSTYLYPLGKKRADAHCQGNRCKFPCASTCFNGDFRSCPCPQFTINAKNRHQKATQTFGVMDFVSNANGGIDNYSIKHFTLGSSGTIVPVERTSNATNDLY